LARDFKQKFTIVNICCNQARLSGNTAFKNFISLRAFDIPHVFPDALSIIYFITISLDNSMKNAISLLAGIVPRCTSTIPQLGNRDIAVTHSRPQHSSLFNCFHSTKTPLWCLDVSAAFGNFFAVACAGPGLYKGLGIYLLGNLIPILAPSFINSAV
jgi:hypothetical protein